MGGGGVFTAVHLHPVEERLSRNEGGGGARPLWNLSHTLCSTIQNVFMLSYFDILFCCRMAAIHFCMLLRRANLIFANFSWIMVPM